MDRIYKYRITQYPTHVDMEEWSRHAEEVWGDPDKAFFLPRENKIFLSRSSAQERVNIVRAWGGDAEVLEATPAWVEAGEASRRRKAARDQKRAAKLRAQADLLDGGEAGRRQQEVKRRMSEIAETFRGLPRQGGDAA